MTSNAINNYVTGITTGSDSLELVREAINTIKKDGGVIIPNNLNIRSEVVDRLIDDLFSDHQQFNSYAKRYIMNDCVVRLSDEHRCRYFKIEVRQVHGETPTDALLLTETH